jgi:hypothetical protein
MIGGKAMSDITGREVQVEFPHTHAIWNKVIVESEEDMDVVYEGSGTFLVMYSTEEDYNHAVNRFDGMIEHTATTFREPEDSDFDEVL